MLSVRLDSTLESQLNQVSKVKNTTKTEVIKNALNYYFDMIKDESKVSPYSLGKNLFGKYSSSQENLSTTYKQTLKEKLNAKHNHR